LREVSLQYLANDALDDVFDFVRHQR
jgi:hypothetical protein